MTTLINDSEKDMKHTNALVDNSRPLDLEDDEIVSSDHDSGQCSPDLSLLSKCKCSQFSEEV